MISLALYIRDRQEKDRRHELQISESIRGSDGIQLSYVSTKDAKVRTVENLLDWQTCRGHSVSLANTVKQPRCRKCGSSTEFFKLE